MQRAIEEVGAIDCSTWDGILYLEKKNLLPDHFPMPYRANCEQEMLKSDKLHNLKTAIDGHHVYSGASVKAGVSHGATGDPGYHAVENVVQLRDLHATTLHLFGINHQRFVVKYQGLDMRFTGVEPANPVQMILA